MMKLNKEKLLSLLQQPSTWKGIVMVLSASGVGIAPALATQIILVGTSMFGLIEIVRDENK